jgi:hypothetical protein
MIERDRLLRLPGPNSERTEGPNSMPTTAPLVHSRDYRSVTIGGGRFNLTPRQAQMIQILHEAYQSGFSELAITYVLEQLETKNSRWQDTWKKNKDARIALIKSGERKGTLSLNL